MRTDVGKAPRLHELHDGADDGLRGVAVVCPPRRATTIATAIDASDPLLAGPLDAPPSTATPLDGGDRAVAAVATPLLRGIVSP